MPDRVGESIDNEREQQRGIGAHSPAGDIAEHGLWESCAHVAWPYRSSHKTSYSKDQGLNY